MTRMKNARRTKQSKTLELAERMLARLPPRWRVKSLAELVPLAVLAFIAAALYAFAQLADEILEGEAFRFDEAILRALRNPADLADPIGPRWLETAMLDITALGGTAVLTLITAGVVGFLLMDQKRGAALFVLIAVVGGSLLTTLAKFAFARPRPELVAHLVDVSSYSFPSGHAMSSAVTYLTLGALLARTQARKRIKAYLLGVAVLLTLMIGVSRVYLGVHYPSDVLAGWSLGAAWAMLCWQAERFLQQRGQVERED
jgi:undecaprenyl-diphosphatase